MAHVRAEARESTPSASSRKESDESSKSSFSSFCVVQGPLRAARSSTGHDGPDQAALNGPALRPRVTMNERDFGYTREEGQVADTIAQMLEPGTGTLDEVSATGTQGMCPRCRRRYREGKPLNCEECEARLETAQARPEGGSIGFSLGRGAHLKTDRDGNSQRLGSPAYEQKPEDERDQSVSDVLLEWPACYGGGSSSCNYSTGNWEVTSNDNHCCTRECTQRHEEQHVADAGECCRKVSEEIASGGDRGRLINQFGGWIRANRDRFECNAYPVSLQCAREKWDEHNCDSVSSECCDEIEGYMKLANRQRNNYCAGAPDSLSPCPF